MRASRNIYAPNLNLEHLTQALSAWYRTEHYDVERSDLDKGSVQLRCLRFNGERYVKPSILVTMHRQDAGLAVEIKMAKRGRPLLIIALCFSVLVALVGLLADSSGSGLFLLGIALCAFCVYRLSRNGKMPARTFTVIEQFVRDSNSTALSLPSAPPGQGHHNVLPVQQSGHYMITGPKRQAGDPPLQASGRDEPIGSAVQGMTDSILDAGASSFRLGHGSARDEPIGSLAPDTTTSYATSPADDLVLSAFSYKESGGTIVPDAGAATKACSCGEINPMNASFCVECGQPLTKPI